MVFENDGLDWISNEVDEREAVLNMEHDMNIDALEVFIQMHTNLIQKHELYKARMKKYEWIESLLRTTARFFRYLLPKQHRS